MKLPAGLIEVHSLKLVDLRLLTRSTGIIETSKCRFSPFGLEFCSYIVRYDQRRESAAKS
jgi:hypothetical protein